MSAVMLRTLLEGEGYEVHTASTVGDARKLFNQATFSHAIVDLMLPDGSGEDIIRLVRERHPRTGVIVVTGVSDPERLKRLREYQAIVLIKPVATEELLKAMTSGPMAS